MNKINSNEAVINEDNSLVKRFFITISKVTTFVFHFFKELFIPPYEVNELIKQSYRVGNKSLLLIGATGFIMGLVLTIQSRPALADFGAQSWLPAMVSISIFREIGPMITALLCAGKVGSSIGSELASMKVTEQLDAMEVSGINPFKYVVVTRIVATTLMLPLLVVFADLISLYGSYVGVNLSDNVSMQLFIVQVFEKLQFSDIFPAFIKSLFFGFVIGVISCYAGYTAESGTEGVGKAANSAVVYSSFMIFLIDMIAVQLTSMFT